MHQLILITAMSATTGLFGGGKHCGKVHHGKTAVMASSCYFRQPLRRRPTPRRVAGPIPTRPRPYPGLPGRPR